MKRKIYFLVSVCALLLPLVSCKPTEKNYRAAYEAAKGKRETVDTDADILNSGRIDEPSSNEEKVREFKVETRHFNPGDDIADYMFVIARYGMSTNAEAHAASLRDKKLHAHAVTLGPEEWYVVAASFPDVEAAQEFGRKYESKHQSEKWIGLTEPFILHANR